MLVASATLVGLVAVEGVVRCAASLVSMAKLAFQTMMQVLFTVHFIALIYQLF
jgi:hypothetical protein